ncbi:MAG: methyltransferase domain-containing protein [Thiomargarita sp.]|nr:methyltransferase domain-containing protein [Thiomargarita sp.]
MLIKQYFRHLYLRTMQKAYDCAYEEIVNTLSENGGKCLDCGASEGKHFDYLKQRIQLEKKAYYGIEWEQSLVHKALDKGLNMKQGDLNYPLPYENDTFQCVFALSLLEHLLNGCQWMRESKRILRPNGRLIILTPNISTFFTMALLAVGKMPSSGPHPDSQILLTSEIASIQVSDINNPDVESETPVHRHLVVFSYRVLKKYLELLGFENIRGYGFGLYPFPNFMQTVLEKVDPYHCHQMVFVATKSSSNKQES